jgi:putative methyltransferase (TIGR04325 family)
MNFIKKLRHKLIRILDTKPKLGNTFGSYEEAVKNGGSYNNKKLVKVIAEKSKNYRDELRISNHLDLSIWRTSFMLSQLSNKKNINILDFGGGAGTAYFLARKLLGSDIRIKWNVVETSLMVKEAKNAKLEDDELKFFNTIDAAVQDLKSIDLIYANGALTYTDKPLNYLDQLLSLDFDLFFITRTPLNEKSRKNIVGIQLSTLSRNGQGPIPKELNIEDEIIKYPYTAISKELFEEKISEFAKVKFLIREDKNAYQTREQNFDMFGYLVEKV